MNSFLRAGWLGAGLLAVGFIHAGFSVAEEGETPPPGPFAEARQWAEQRFAAFFSDHHWVEITLAEVLEGVERDNPTLQRAALGPEMAAAGVRAAEAGFDPVLSASLGYTREDQSQRLVTDRDYRGATGACATATCGFDDASPVYRVYGSTSPVNYLKFNTERPAGFYSKTIEASPNNPTGLDERLAYNASVSQSFGWGGSATLTQSTTREHREWVLNRDSNNPYSGPYGRPWTSEASASLWSPLPGTRNFGYDGPLESARRTALVEQRRAGQALRQSRETLRNRAAQAFWTLVERLMVLETSLENRGVAAELARAQAVLFTEGRVTPYAVSQAEGEAARADEAANAAWQAYLSASNDLNQLIDFDPARLLVPAGFVGQLAAVAPLSLIDALTLADAANPELRSLRLAQETANIAEEQGAVNARPDLSVSVSFKAAQVGWVYGYPTYLDSVGNLANPDRITWSGGVNFRRPWGNEGPEAAHRQAQADQRVAGATLEEAVNRVQRSVKDAHALLASAQARQRLSCENRRLARETFRTARISHAAGRLDNYQMMSHHRDRVAADTAVVLARIARKTAETRLLGAIGGDVDYLAGAGEGDDGRLEDPCAGIEPLEEAGG